MDEDDLLAELTARYGEFGYPGPFRGTPPLWLWVVMAAVALFDVWILVARW